MRRIIMDHIRQNKYTKWAYKIGVHYRNRIVERSYWKKKIKNTEKYTPVLVFQMGKVGSSSIYYSIKNTYKGDALHFHTYKDRKKSWKMEAFYNFSVIRKQPIKIISLIREPISRNIAAFFEHFLPITGKYCTDSVFSISDLKKIFLEHEKINHENYRGSFFHVDEPLTWFDNNLLKDYNFDVYEFPFSKAGWQIYKKENAEILIMKSEISDEIKKNVVRKFLNFPEFQLSASNIGEKKYYANIYKKFKDEVKLPSSYLNKVLNSKYTRHFYSSEEIDRIRERWVEK